jgi:hypothetical protein
VFEEIEMKKKLLLTGLASVLLVAGMMLVACGKDDDDGGGKLSAPKLGNLPALPAGVVYVSDGPEAEALLEDIGGAFYTIGDAVENLIDAHAYAEESGNGYSWDVKDDKFISGLIINSKGTEKGTEEGSHGYSVSDETTIEFIDDKTESGVTVYKGSKVAKKEDGATTSTSSNGSLSYACGWTVSSNGKGAKIILEANVKVNGSVTTIKYSGSLKVYGDNNAPVYEKAIDKNEVFNEIIIGLFHLQ